MKLYKETLLLFKHSDIMSSFNLFCLGFIVVSLSVGSTRLDASKFMVCMYKVAEVNQVDFWKRRQEKVLPLKPLDFVHIHAYML